MRVNYRGVQVLCTKCFGKHHKSKCETRKAQFKDYVINFAERNPGFPEEAYGRWIELIRAARGGQRQVPVTGSGSGELDVAPASLPTQCPETATAAWLSKTNQTDFTPTVPLSIETATPNPTTMPAITSSQLTTDLNCGRLSSTDKFD